MNRVITILGCGPVGVAALTDIWAKSVSGVLAPHDIIIVNPEGAECGGTAFGAEHTAEGLTFTNMPASMMSIFPQTPSDFARWLTTKGIMPQDAEPNSYYATREAYGKYLTKRLKKHIALLRKRGIRVKVIRSEAVDIDPYRDAWKLTLKDGQTFVSHEVIVAIGGFAANSYPGLRRSPRAIAHAYPFTPLQEIPHDASVLIGGTSLTMIDTIIWLLAQGHEGPIVVTSSSGVLPSVRPRYRSDFTPTICTPENLRSFSKRWGCPATVELFLQLFEHECVAQKVPLEDVNFMRDLMFENENATIRRLAQSLNSSGQFSMLFTVLTTVARQLPQIWDMWSDEERAKWRATYETRFAAAAFPCPPQNGRRLLEWLRSGRVRILGTVSRDPNSPPAIRDNGEAIQVDYIDGTTQQFDWFVNATGLSYDVESEVAAPLYKRLVAKGIVQPHAKLGVRVDFNSGAVLKESGISWPGLYVVGALTRGTHYYTNSVFMNALSAQRVVDDIALRNGGTLIMAAE